MIFYDQLGCGKSSMPSDIEVYSISKSVDDLEILIETLKLSQFHLLGHSYGGVLAYEYIKRASERAAVAAAAALDSTCVAEESTPLPPRCLSLLLSNSPTSMALSDQEWDRLLDELRKEDDNIFTLDERFRKRNQCRTPSVPPALADAFRHVGTTWHGTGVVSDYIALPPSSDQAAKALPPTILIRGEHDFVTEVCVEGWRELFGKGLGGFRETIMDGCSHYCHLEDGENYGALVGRFCSEFD